MLQIMGIQPDIQIISLQFVCCMETSAIYYSRTALFCLHL